MKNSLDFANCWINGRTLRFALQQTDNTHKLSPFRINDRVSINPDRDACLRAPKYPQYPFAFCTGNDVMATVLDIGVPTPTIYEFGIFHCTASALESSSHWIQMENPTTDAVQAQGRRLLADAWDESFDFSRQVCEWGGGGRVWGNLNRHYAPEALQSELRRWFVDVNAANGDSNIIVGGLKIKGLGVSFASKHLRLLKPDQYAVLDDVLSLGIGFALNPAGYELFMHELKRFKDKYEIAYSISKIESALFGLIRQSVRGQVVSIN